MGRSSSPAGDGCSILLGMGPPGAAGRGVGAHPCLGVGTLDPRKAREAPVPRGVMSQAGIPQKRWKAKSSHIQGGVGASRGEAQAGSPMS